MTIRSGQSLLQFRMQMNCVFFKSLFAALSQYIVNRIAGGILDESFNCNKVFEELHAAYPNVLIVDLDISINN